MLVALSRSPNVKENFDLSVVQFGRFLCQPTARLVMEVLQVITGSRRAGDLVQDFVVRAPFATPMDVRKIVEKHS